MKVFCKKCYTKYSIADEMIGAKGRNVKCTQCSYIWFQRQSESMNFAKRAKIQTDSKVETSILPVVIEYFTPKWLKLIPAFFACLVVITGGFVFQDFLSSEIPFFSKFYDGLGLPSTKQVVLSNVQIREKNRDVIELNGFVVNKSPNHKKIPSLLVNMINNNNKVSTQRIAMPDHYLKQGEKCAFYKKLDKLPPNTKYVSVVIADKFDVLFYPNSPS